MPTQRRIAAFQGGAFAARKSSHVPQRRFRAVETQATQAVVLYSDEKSSPLNGAPWRDVFDLMATRFAWEEQDLSLKAFSQTEAQPGGSAAAEFEAACADSSVFVGVGLQDATASKLLDSALSMRRPAAMVFDSASEFEARTTLAGLPVTRLPSPLLSLLGKMPGGWGRAANTWPLLKQMWQRRSSDDLAFALMLAIDKFAEPVPSTQVNMGDAQSFVDMCTKCRKEIVACVQDPQCKKALDGLSACGLNDQVCSYRVLASYESPLLENFSRCILQKHNCLRNAAEIPMTPAPEPLASFRGDALTWEAAEDIFIGHLAEGRASKPERFSWRVAAGKNPAYDFFPCQFQLWYRAKGKGMWYDPIFKVITLDGRETWRRRHYKVRRAEMPGCFYFSVLDNGVTSNEYWRIMDCAEDMAWAVYYYSGAASAAGITYRGALICTPSGELPTGAEASERVDAALAACGIKRWEMFAVDNAACADAPLSVPASGDVRLRALA